MLKEYLFIPLAHAPLRKPFTFVRLLHAVILKLHFRMQ